MRKSLFLLLMLCCASMNVDAQKAELKPRLVVCTDIGAPDVEPDDMESAVRLMAYADQFEIEGIFMTIGWNCDPYPDEWAEYLDKVLVAYEKDVTKLMKRSGQEKFFPLAQENGKQLIGYWPSPSYIRERAMKGSTRAGIKVIGEGNDSPGSNFLIRLADEPDERPIWVASWGGANTLAQAIWRVQQTRTPEQVRQFVRKFRVYTITDQDMQYSMRMDRAYSSHQWLRREFKDDLKFIWDEGTWQLQCDLGKEHWEEHVKFIQGKGALGAEYPTYKWGVEGDTPSFLYVMPNGLSDPEDPTQVNWGGYHRFGLCPDSLTYAWTSWEQPTYNTTRDYKRLFYLDELNDFKARMQWADEGKGNTNPVVIVNGFDGRSVLHLHAEAGTQVRLNASQSYDREGDAVSFSWWQQKEAGLDHQPLSILVSESSVATVQIPQGTQGKELHFICEVHDNGPFHLVAYRRVIIHVE